MRIDCDINKTISRLNCKTIKLIDIRTNVVRNSHECLTTVMGLMHECLTTVILSMKDPEKICFGFQLKLKELLT